ncbi:MAG: NADH-quinone oxidoreductase subunit NuoG [Acidimicrobiia bacterium]|nr:NADH-quinone oxidoreductase subunit NuoG [Acidimicrobiia bacterium]
MADPVTITLDGEERQVPAGTLLIQAAQDEGTYIPRFCWHPRMKPVGMCRMCLVEVDTGRGPALTTSCTMPCTEGMVVDTKSDVVKKAQEGVLEFLLINHPLDCPVCDRGGECPLQDQTMAYGPGESRFVEEKRHFEKPIEISELVLLDRERCILCARCTRFSDEVSGDPLIEFQDRGNYTQVLTFPNEPFKSYFSGNTVQICPVGALTAKPYRFRARPWDLEAVESTCPHCAVGCRISVQSSQNQVLRFLGVDNEPTNQGWLCDKGRFGFEYIGSPERLTVPLVRSSTGELEETSWSAALGVVGDWLQDLITEHGPDSVAGLGGARGTNEDAYAFGKLIRAVIGTNNIDAQLDDGLNPQFLAAATSRATIPDLDAASTILLWGPDLKEELPVLYLRVRQAVQNGASLIVVHPRRTGLDDVATVKVGYAPGQGPDLLASLRAGEGELAAARELLLAGGAIVGLVGRTGLTEDPLLAEGVAAFVRDLPEAKIMPLGRRSNLFGALDMGLAPSLLPGRAALTSAEARSDLSVEWATPIPEKTGKDAAGIVAGLEAGTVKGLLLFGADPVRDFSDPSAARAALEAANLVVAVDQFLTDSSQLADVVLPAEGFTETEGTVTNLEGRVQRVAQLIAGSGQARPPWSVFEDIALALGSSLGAESVEGIQKEIAQVAPAYRTVRWDELGWGDGREGVVVPGDGGEQPLHYVPVDIGLSSSSARLALHSARTLYDDGVHVRHSLSLAKLAPGAFVFINPADGARLGVADGVLARVTGSSGSADLEVRYDPSLTEGVVYVPANQDEGWDLGQGLEIKLEVLS